MAIRKKYPDVSPLLASHEAYRQKLASLSWEEKVAIMERMRDDLREWHQHGAGPDRAGTPKAKMVPIGKTGKRKSGRCKTKESR